MTADLAPAADAAPRARFRPPAVPQVAVRGFWGARIDAVCARTADTLYRRCEEAGMLEQIDPDRPGSASRSMAGWSPPRCSGIRISAR